MLVLSRKFQEKIRIGNEITITILRAKGKAVRLGIEAPADIPVIRGELAFEDACGEQSTVACKAWPAPEPSMAATAKRRQHLQRNTVSIPAGQVALGRVSRAAAAAGLMPQLLPGQSPLRAMLDQRAATA